MRRYKLVQPPIGPPPAPIPGVGEIAAPRSRQLEDARARSEHLEAMIREHRETIERVGSVAGRRIRDVRRMREKRKADERLWGVLDDGASRSGR